MFIYKPVFPATATVRSYKNYIPDERKGQSEQDYVYIGTLTGRLNSMTARIYDVYFGTVKPTFVYKYGNNQQHIDGFSFEEVQQNIENKLLFSRTIKLHRFYKQAHEKKDE